MEGMTERQYFKKQPARSQDYAIFAIDEEGTIKTWNQGAVKMKLYTPQEAIGSHFSILYPKEARDRNEPMEHLREAAQKGRYRGQGIRVRKNGEEFLAEVQITAMYEDGEIIGFSKVVAERSKIN